MRKSDASRRTFIRALGTGAGALVGSGGIVAADTDLEKPDDPRLTAKEARKLIKERYPGETGPIFGTANKYLAKVKADKLSPSEARDRYVQEIYADEHAQAIEQEIRDTRELRKQLRSGTKNNSLSSTESEFGTSAVGDTRTVSLTYGQTGASSSGATITNRRADPANKTMGAYVQAAFVGSGVAFARLYGRFTPSTSIGGNVRISANYFRLGNTIDASTTIRLFVRETGKPGSTTIKRNIETPNSADGSTTKSEQFFLKSGVKYDVGIELESSISYLGVASGFSDFFATHFDFRQRRLDVLKPLTVTSLD